MVKKSGVALIFSTLFIDVAAMGMLIPVLPELLRGFVDGDFGRAAQLAGLIAAGLARPARTRLRDLPRPKPGPSLSARLQAMRADERY